MQKERHELRENNDLPPGLAKPAQRALTRAGYSRLDQFTKLSEEEILQLHGMGAQGPGSDPSRPRRQGPIFR